MGTTEESVASKFSAQKSLLCLLTAILITWNGDNFAEGGTQEILYHSRLHRFPGRLVMPTVTPLVVRPWTRIPRACLEACFEYGGCKSFNFNVSYTLFEQ
jgi:hypothetical protein